MRSQEAKEKPKRKRRIGLKVLLVMLVVLCLAGAAALIADAPGRQELATLEIGSIDFSRLEDGTCTGSYTGAKGSARDATVEVTIQQGQITAIRTIKGAIDENGTAVKLSNGETVDDLFSRVVEDQSLQVDAISGATLTSKAHLKALENALTQAQNRP